MHGTEVEDDHASERGSSVNSQLSLPLFPLVHAGEGGDQSDFGLPLIPWSTLTMCIMWPQIWTLGSLQSSIQRLTHAATPCSLSQLPHWISILFYFLFLF